MIPPRSSTVRPRSRRRIEGLPHVSPPAVLPVSGQVGRRFGSVVLDRRPSVPFPSISSRCSFFMPPATPPLLYVLPSVLPLYHLQSSILCMSSFPFRVQLFIRFHDSMCWFLVYNGGAFFSKNPEKYSNRLISARGRFQRRPSTARKGWRPGCWRYVLLPLNVYAVIHL